MTYEEAQNLAIQAGALEPQTVFERAAAGVLAAQRGQSWASTLKAQSRLEAWTQAILAGRDPRREG